MKFLSVLLFGAALTFNTQASVNSPAAVRELQFDNNVEAPLKQQMLDDLAFMASISGLTATQLHTQIFGAVKGQDYLAWFNKRVFKVGKSDCGSANAVACVMPMYRNKIWMTKNYTQFSHPQIARLSVVYHEARHTESENGNWGHATCPRPFKNEQGQDYRSIWTGAVLAGEPACDVTAFGSYGSQTILMRNIATKCSNCGEKVKADANLYAMDQLNRVIDKNVKDAMKRDFGMARR